MSLSTLDIVWAKEEAFAEASHYVSTVLQDFDERNTKLEEKLLKDFNHWKKVFEDDELLQIFITEFNLRVPEFSKMDLSWLVSESENLDMF